MNRKIHIYEKNLNPADIKIPKLTRKQVKQLTLEERKQRTRLISKKSYHKRAKEIAKKRKAKADKDIELYRERKRKEYKKYRKRIRSYFKIYSNTPNVQEKRKKYYKENLEKILQNKKDKRKEFPERQRKINQKRRKKILSDPKLKAKYDATRRKYESEREKKDINYKLKRRIKARVYQGIKSGKGKKIFHLEQIVGCSLDQLKKHIESHWQTGMNWNNWGEKGWHIDHHMPIASFDLTDPEQQKKCFNYKNLKPLWAKENLNKRDKIPFDEIFE